MDAHEIFGGRKIRINLNPKFAKTSYPIRYMTASERQRNVTASDGTLQWGPATDGGDGFDNGPRIGRAELSFFRGAEFFILWAQNLFRPHPQPRANHQHHAATDCRHPPLRRHQPHQSTTQNHRDRRRPFRTPAHGTVRLPITDHRTERLMRSQPCAKLLRASCSGERREQNKGNGRQSRHHDADDAKPETHVREKPPKPTYVQRNLLLQTQNGIGYFSPILGTMETFLRFCVPAIWLTNTKARKPKS